MSVEEKEANSNSDANSGRSVLLRDKAQLTNWQKGIQVKASAQKYRCWHAILGDISNQEVKAAVIKKWKKKNPSADKDPAIHEQKDQLEDDKSALVDLIYERLHPDVQHHIEGDALMDPVVMWKQINDHFGKTEDLDAQMRLQTEMGESSKEGKTVEAYITMMKTHRTSYMNVGGALSNKQFILYILNGLGGEKSPYWNARSLLTDKLAENANLSVNVVRSKLLAVEATLARERARRGEDEEVEEEDPVESSNLARLEARLAKAEEKAAKAELMMSNYHQQDRGNKGARGGGRSGGRGGGRSGGQRSGRARDRRDRGGKGGKGGGECWNCGGTGHRSRDCPSDHRDRDGEETYYHYGDWWESSYATCTEVTLIDLDQAVCNMHTVREGWDVIVDGGSTCDLVGAATEPFLYDVVGVDETVLMNKHPEKITKRAKVDYEVIDSEGRAQILTRNVALCPATRANLLSESAFIADTLKEGGRRRAAVVKVATDANCDGVTAYLARDKEKIPLTPRGRLFFLRVRPVARDEAFVNTRSGTTSGGPPAEPASSDPPDDAGEDQAAMASSVNNKTTLSASSVFPLGSVAWMRPFLAAVEARDAKQAIHVLHQDTGHMSVGKLKELLRQGAVSVPEAMGESMRRIVAKDLPCSACAEARATKKGTATRKRRHMARPEWVMDVDGPNPIQTMHGERWTNVTVSPKGMVFVALMKKKKHTGRVLREKRKVYEILANEKMEAIRTDLGSEYVSRAEGGFAREAARLGLYHRKTAPDSSAGPAENRIRYVNEKAKTIMIAAKAPEGFWGEAKRYAADCMNFQPSEGGECDGLSAYESSHQRKPPLHMLRRWGSKGYAHIPKTLRRKFGKRSRPAIFVGLAREGSEGYRLWCPRTKRFFHSRSVIFHEDILGFGEESNPKDKSRAWGVVKPPVVRTRGEEIDFDPTELDAVRVYSGEGSDHIEERDKTARAQRPQRDHKKPSAGYNPDEIEAVALVKRAEKAAHEATMLTRPRSIGRTLAFVATVPTVARPEVPKGLRPESVIVPHTKEEALSGPQASFWAWAIFDEDDGMAKNKAMEWAKRDTAAKEGKTVLPSMYVFSLKLNAEGEVARFKVRWVAKGFRARAGADYDVDEIFCPTLDWSSVLAITNMALMFDLELHQTDVKTAFLVPPLEAGKHVYMEPPRERRGGAVSSEWILRLLKCIYGLKNSGHYWNAHVHKFLLANGFTAMHSDPCIYVHRTKGKIDCVVGVFVDDFIIAAKSGPLKRAKDMMKREYDIKDLGQVSLFLGVNFKWGRRGEHRRVELSQKAYIEEILETFGMTDCRPRATPCAEPRPCTPDYPATEQEKKDMEGKDYRKLIGMLRYASKKTRPDIEFVVSLLARFQEDPRPQHWEAGMRVVAYLAGTRDYVLRYDTSQGTSTLTGFTDSDHAPRGGEEDKRRSTSGSVFTINGGVISWSSRKQSTTAKSTAEAELIAIGSAAQEGVWIRNLFRELEMGFAPGSKPPTLFCDNSAAIQIASNRKLSKKTKHLDVDYFVVRGVIENNKLRVKKIASDMNISDVMTKPLGRVKFEGFRRAI